MSIKDVLFYGIILTVIALGIYMVHFVNSESYKCINSPLVYGVNHLQSSDASPVTCSCFSKTTGARILITNESVTIE